MSETTTTAWTCERCGVVERVEGNGQPKNWTRIYFVSPPRVAMSEATRVGDLCNECGGFLISFVHGHEVEDMERAAELKRMVAAVEAAQ